MTDEPSSVIDITRKRAMINFGINGTGLLAQVNFGANSASVLGIFLAVAGAALYFLRTVRPELSRDQDIFFAAVGLLCGFILIFQGWRLDPILQFGQLLLVGSTVFFAVESIRLRSIATQQAKRNTPIVDDEREVSKKYSYSQRRNYQAEVDEDLDPLPYYEEEEPEPPNVLGFAVVGMIVLVKRATKTLPSAHHVVVVRNNQIHELKNAVLVMEAPPTVLIVMILMKIGALLLDQLMTGKLPLQKPENHLVLVNLNLQNFPRMNHPLDQEGVVPLWSLLSLEMMNQLMLIMYPIIP
ncbi:Ycf66-like protein [Raphidiopsis brookii D9]|nr:Ycf66-like protein [Raphidiopsis brookii D9]